MQIKRSLNPPSQEGGGCCPPFRIFPRAVFAKIAIRSIYPPFVQIPCIYEKMFPKFCHEKGWGGGGWGVATTPRPEREGVAAKINNFL